MLKKMTALLLAMLLAISGAFACAEGEISQEEWDKIVAEEGGEETTGEGEWWNILLLGCDSYTKNTYSRSDSMIILSLNLDTKQAKLTSLMRDIWIKVPGYKSKHRKLTELCAVGGPELTIQAINENFGMDIENYILINMADMAEIVDLFGGVEVEVSPSEMKVANGYINEAKNGFYNERLDSYDYTPISETGMIRLNGVQAMAYCRDRYTDSDFGRVMRQQEVLLALAAEAKQLEIEDAVEIAGKIGEFVSTNLEPEQIVELAKAVLGIEIENVGQYRIPAEGDYDSGTFSGTWMIRPKLEKVKASLKAFIYGEE